MSATTQIVDLVNTTNKKEKVDMILEPLQVMITLALLSFCPVGTKIYISKNILYVHEPSVLQGVYRWLDGNSKDDLYYLFHAIRRYYKWYKTIDNKVYELIMVLAKNGIKKLMTTYKDANQKTILHTLSLYHNILELNNEQLFESKDHADVINIDQVFKNVKTVYDKKILMITYHTLVLMQETANENEVLQYMNGLKMLLTPTEKNIRNWIQTNLTL
jgi:hypothetical protein|tara:strand:+ start:579 stop:1229 length:651 start_codon:yes stop_codon:yes gene_type:complete